MNDDRGYSFKMFLNCIQRHDFKIFGVYRVASPMAFGLYIVFL